MIVLKEPIGVLCFRCNIVFKTMQGFNVHHGKKHWPEEKRYVQLKETDFIQCNRCLEYFFPQREYVKHSVRCTVERTQSNVANIGSETA